MKRLTFIIAFLFLACGAFCQNTTESFESALIPKKGGAVVVYSSDKHSFTLDLNSDKLKPLDQPGYVSMDNKILQFNYIQEKTFKADTGASEEQGQLLAYMQSELDYDKNELKLDYTNPAHEFISVNNKQYLLWYFDMPKKYKSVIKQINLTTLCFGHILSINSPLEKKDYFDDSKNLLIKVYQTLKLNDFKIDFNELYKKLNP